MSISDEQPNRIARAQFVCEGPGPRGDGECWNVTKHRSRICRYCESAAALREIHAGWAHTIGEEDNR